jgi:2-phosphosulfolactate phosphatase
MELKRASLETCGSATDMVVVIDVLRAFTTAAHAFAAGAHDILLVGTVEEALALRRRMQGALVMGEVDGLPVAGFDLGNSPSALVGMDLTGRRLIQRTSAGTQGVVRSTQASALLACSFVCAGATARYIRQRTPASVTFVITGANPNHDGDEDAACADYLESLLGTEDTIDSAPFVGRVPDSGVGRIFADPGRPTLPAADLARAMAVDLFGFAMPVERKDGLLTMKPVRFDDHGLAQ